jgi:MarR family transcriptional regulator, organic hydroperoxide resistance regulator
MSCGIDEAVTDILNLLLLVATGIRECREAIRETLRLTTPQFTILIGVAFRKANGGIMVRALAEHAQIAPAHVTTEVRRLVEMNLLAKLPNKNDGRSDKANPQGQRAMTSVHPLLRRSSEVLFQDIKAEILCNFSARCAL